jgi:HSP20 family protein
LTDKGDSFLVEADLPGVKRENLEVRIGDRGRSLIIEAKTVERTEGSEANEG